VVVFIPLTIIFLSLTYLEVANNITIIDKSIVTIIIIATLTGSYIMYKKIKQNFKQHEINLILMEINEIKKKLQSSKEEKEVLYLTLKLKRLKEELDTIQVS
jgi:hypothetical protein